MCLTLCREHGHGSHYDCTRTEGINGLGVPGIPKGAHLGPSPSPQNTCRFHGQVPMNDSEVLIGWKCCKLLHSQSSIVSPESQLRPFQHHGIDIFRAVWYAHNLPHTLLKMGMTNPVCLSTDTVPDIHMTLKRYVNQRQSHIVSQFLVNIHFSLVQFQNTKMQTAKMLILITCSRYTETYVIWHIRITNTKYNTNTNKYWHFLLIIY